MFGILPLLDEATQQVLTPRGPSWHLDLFGEVLGPFTTEEIIEGLRSHSISPEATVSATGSAPWLSLGQAPEFTAVVAEIRAAEAGLKAA